MLLKPAHPLLLHIVCARVVARIARTDRQLLLVRLLIFSSYYCLFLLAAASLSSTTSITTSTSTSTSTLDVKKYQL
jgi:hypothetical protein